MSSIDPQIRDQAYQFFTQESIEFLQTIEEGLMELRTDHSIPVVHNLMRAAHSIKGGAASVGLPGIQQIAHRMEDVFRALYRIDKEIDQDVEGLLLQAYDSLRAPLIEQIETGSYDAEAAIESAEPIFSVLEGYLGDSLGADLELPTAAELGFDIAQVVFSGDVTMGIERLQAVLAHPEIEQVSGEIRAQAEVFAGIGELLNLPGFSAIANHTILALDANPNNPTAVGQAAVENFLAAQEAVLAGDRTSGGSPSDRLIALIQANGSISTSSALDSSDRANIANITDTTNQDLSALFADALATEDLTTNAFADLGNALGSSFGLDADLPDSTDFSDLGGMFAEDETGLGELTDNFTSAFGNDLSDEGFISLDSSAENLTGFTDILPNQESESSRDPQSAENSQVAPGLTSLDQLLSIVDNIEPEAALTPFKPISFENDIDLNDASVSLEDLFSVVSESEDNAIPGLLGTNNIPVAKPAEISPQPTFSRSEKRQAKSGNTESSIESTAVTSSAASPQISASMIRVDLGRLERISNLVGELVTQENGTMLRSMQLQETLLTLQRRFKNFEKIAKELEKWADNSQRSKVRSQNSESYDRVIPTASISLPTLPGTSSALTELAGFDPLLMDSYSYVYTVVQEAVEEIAQMGETMQDMSLLTQQAQQAQINKQQTLKQVRNDILWARMMPLNEILQRFPRMVRDLSAKNDKQVRLKTIGTNTLVDKAVLEKLFDPLVHLIRNAFDHGTESPQARKKQGKTPEATIEIRAYHRGNQTYIEVRDDGRGIDLEKVRASAIAKEVMTLEAASTATQSELYDLLFSPSFSTAEKVSELSGRGMGLSAVRSQIISLKGNITINSEVGQGTTFVIRLPLTLTIAKLLIFSINSHLMAIPVDTLSGLVTANDSEIIALQGRQFYRYRAQVISNDDDSEIEIDEENSARAAADRIIPLYPHSEFSYNYPLPKGAEEQLSTMALPDESGIPLLLISSGDKTIAMEVDQILSEQELVIKPFGKGITSPTYIYGCTIQGDGSMLPVIDGLALVSKLLQQPDKLVVGTTESSKSSGYARASVEEVQKEAATILVVDDSLTTRQTLALTLKKAGYRIIQAGDGREALDKLKQEPGIDAVFSDVEMPRMNGFEFLSQCRQDRAYTNLPIIMLTSRSGEKHRSLAKLLKATAYLTKPYLEQDLLKTLQSCLEKQPAVAT
jgi:two-component system, chemotaxis family, sensor histidine kinase and response regulator PixL